MHIKTRGVLLLIVSVSAIVACSPHRKNSRSSTASTVSTTASPTPVATPTATFPVIKPANGIYAPGSEELAAIQVQYKDVTMGKLQEGHTLYTQSACIQCHEPMNIYVHSPAQWKDIIGDMAQRARITDDQRDAVYKYVLAIKAAQPK